MTDTALVPTKTALDALKRTTERSSLDDLVAARTRRSLLLVDVSSSMSETVRKTMQRKIDALRTVVTGLRKTHPVPMAAFGLRSGSPVELVETIPEPQGMTPLHKAIAYGREQGANHLVVVTDGCPDSESAAYAEADAFKGPIDVFYIGNGGDHGAAFCAALAKRTGGQCGLTDLAGDGEQKKLAGKIVALLGDGSEVL